MSVLVAFIVVTFKQQRHLRHFTKSPESGPVAMPWGLRAVGQVSDDRPVVVNSKSDGRPRPWLLEECVKVSSISV